MSRHTEAAMRCIFCERAGDHGADTSSYAMLDQHPVATGHMLVIIGRHVESLLSATKAEWAEIWSRVQDEAERIAASDGVDGLNIGVNIGVAAGQTVPHAHIHIIPRAAGDTDDPRGGVRRILDRGEASTNG